MVGASTYHVKLLSQFSTANGKTPEITITDADSQADSEVILGRSDITGITDKRCSREHTKLKVDAASEELVVTQMGSNPCCLNCRGKDHVLSKHDVKRFPFTWLNDEDCTLHLIHKDMLYGYNIIINREKKPSKDNNGASHGNISHKVAGAKRPSSTLDSFVIKKPKPDQKDSKVKSTVAGTWTEPSPLIFLYTPSELAPSSKIIAFDMDGTLIVTKSGAKWPKNKDDWKFLMSSIPKKLQSLYSEGYKLVIFTNQAGIAQGTQSPNDIKHKLESIINAVGVPMMAMVAGEKRGTYRKPKIGMWSHICSSPNNGVTVDMQSCIYVGDAAGRVANWQPGKKKDFSSSDRLFALNAGIKFATPESFFNGEKEGVYELPEFKPADALMVKNLVEPANSNLYASTQEIIVMVGFPGSGKSYVSTTHLAKYQRVNRDTLGSWQKCVAKCDTEIQNGKSVVVDNTNPDKESRARYIEVAKKHKIPVRCFLMSTSYKQARHNEVYRQLTDSKHKPINDMIVNSYKSKYTEPSLSEGFSEIVKVNFVPKFDNEEQKRLYSMYLLEK